jgi:hypothetical protein
MHGMRLERRAPPASPAERSVEAAETRFPLLGECVFDEDKGCTTIANSVNCPDGPAITDAEGCQSMASYPMYCVEKQAENASPEGTAMTHGQCYMPEGVTMYHGDYAGDAVQCDCECEAEEHDDHDGHDHGEEEEEEHDDEKPTYESDGAARLAPALLAAVGAALATTW